MVAGPAFGQIDEGFGDAEVVVGRPAAIFFPHVGQEAEASAVLPADATMVEAIGGNTGMRLALVAAARGYSLVCVLPEKMKRARIRITT